MKHELLNITIDDGVYDLVDGITIDTDLVMDFLHKKGLSDEQIAELSLRFTAERFKTAQDIGVLGNYEADTRTANVNIYSLLTNARNSRHYGNSLEDKLSEETSGVIAHELMHAVFDHLDPKYSELISEAKSESLKNNVLERIEKTVMLGSAALASSMGVGIAAGYAHSPVAGLAVGGTGFALSSLKIKRKFGEHASLGEEFEYGELIHEQVHKESDIAGLALAKVSLR